MSLEKLHWLHQIADDKHVPPSVLFSALLQGHNSYDFGDELRQAFLTFMSDEN